MNDGNELRVSLHSAELNSQTIGNTPLSSEKNSSHHLISVSMSHSDEKRSTPYVAAIILPEDHKVAHENNNNNETPYLKVEEADVEADDKNNEEERLLPEIQEVKTRKERIEVAICCGDPESTAVIFRDNPVLYALIGWGVGYSVPDQFLKLWPETRADWNSFLTLPAFVVGGIGFTIGAKRIIDGGTSIQPIYEDVQPTATNPNTRRVVSVIVSEKDPRSALAKRVFLAVIHGFGAVFIFILGEVIIVYRNKNCSKPGDPCDVGDDVLFYKFILPVLPAGIFYTIWNILNLNTPEAQLLRRRFFRYGVFFVDYSLQLLLFSRIFQYTLMTIYPNEADSYEYAAVPAAIGTAVLKAIKPHHQQKIQTMLLYLFAANFAYVQGQYFKRVCAGGTSNSDWNYCLFSIIGDIIVLGGGLLLTTLSFRHFTERYIEVEEPKPAVKKISKPKPVAIPHPSPVEIPKPKSDATFLPQKKLLSDRQQQTITADIKKKSDRSSDKMFKNYQVVQAERDANIASDTKLSAEKNSHSKSTSKKHSSINSNSSGSPPLNSGSDKLLHQYQVREKIKDNEKENDSDVEDENISNESQSKCCRDNPCTRLISWLCSR